MIAKLIVHEGDRVGAADALAGACRSVEVWPVKTNAGFLARCADHPAFMAGDVDTGFIERHHDALVPRPGPSTRSLQVGVGWALADAAGREFTSPWSAMEVARGWRLNRAPERSIRLSVDGEPLVTDVGDIDWRDFPTTLHLEEGVVAFESGEAYEFGLPKASVGVGGAASDGAILSPMPGKVVSVSVKAGDTVTKGQTLLVLEAMKMEHALAAPFDGIVAELSATPGGQVSEGVTLAKLEPVS